MMIQDQFPMLKALHAEGPAPDRAAQMMLYGQFIGSWEGRVIHHDAAGREAPCEAHFGWVLEGRAVQDVWITPSRDARGKAGVSTKRNWYGTTLRVYDPQSDIWHITWINPVTQFVGRMSGRKIGDEIVQEYRTENGTLGQWLFTEITGNSFHWIRRESNDDGKTWKVETEVLLQRTGSRH